MQQLSLFDILQQEKPKIELDELFVAYYNGFYYNESSNTNG